MELIFKPIKQLITPQFQEEVYNKLGIDEAALIKLADSIIAGLFGGLLTKGDSSETEKILKTFAFNANDEEVIDVFLLENDLDSERIESARILADAVLFNKKDEFISILVKSTELDESQVESILTTLTYHVGLNLGRKLLTDEYTVTGLLGQMHAERNFFLGYIPSEMISILGVPSLLTIGQNLTSDAKVVGDAVYYEIMHGNKPVVEKKSSWWKWFSFKAAL